MGIPTRRRILFLILWIGKRIFLAACLQKWNFHGAYEQKHNGLYRGEYYIFPFAEGIYPAVFFLLLGIYFVPVLCALLYIIPANDKMLSPISALSRQVQAFSLGTEPPEIWESDDEIGELSSSFYRMAVNINQQSMEISKKSGKRQRLITNC